MEIGIMNELGHVWEWPLGLHFVLSALVAGLSAIAGIAHLKGRKDLAKVAVFFAFPILIVDLLSLILDLGKMWSVYWLYFNFNITSAISWGTWSLTLTAVCLFGYLVDHFKIFSIPKVIINFLAWLLIGSSVVVGTYTGAMFASCLQSVPLWCSMIIAPLFFASAVAMGAALLELFKFGEEISGWSLSLGTFAAGIMLVLYITELYSSPKVTQDAFKYLLTHFGAIWWFTVNLGFILPAILSVIWIVRKQKRSGIIIKSIALLSLFGGISIRFVLLFAGQGH